MSSGSSAGIIIDKNSLWDGLNIQHEIFFDGAAGNVAAFGNLSGGLLTFEVES